MVKIGSIIAVEDQVVEKSAAGCRDTQLQYLGDPVRRGETPSPAHVVVYPKKMRPFEMREPPCPQKRLEVKTQHEPPVVFEVLEEGLKILQRPAGQNVFEPGIPVTLPLR